MMLPRSEFPEYLRGDFAFGRAFFKSFVRMNDVERSMVLDWRNSDAIRERMFTNHLISPEEHQRFLERLEREEATFNWLAQVDGTPVGVASLQGVNPDAEEACVGIYTVRRGFGHLVMEGLVELGFERLGLQRMVCEVLETNREAQDFFRKCGFSLDDRVRYIELNGAPRKILVMSRNR